MRYIGIIILLVLCLNLLLLTGRMINTVTPEIDGNNSQSSSTDPVEEPVIEEDTETTGTVYPQQWATGDGTAENPWANDCIQKAYDFVPAGGTIYLRAGYYQLAGQLSIEKQISIIGEGINQTIVVTANANGFLIDETDYASIKNLTIDGDAQTDGQMYLAPIEIDNSNYVLLEDIEVKNAGYYGISVYQDNYCTFKNFYAHDNWKHGFASSSDDTGTNKYNTYKDIYAWNNGECGFKDRGISDGSDPPEDSYNVFDNIQCWDNGKHGIMIACQKSGVLSNSSSRGSGEIGMELGHLTDFNIHNCISTLSEEEGLRIANSENVNFTNIIVKNNYTGIIIENCSNITLTTCQSYDDRTSPLQDFGMELDGTNTEISLLNCKLTPNKSGDIYNPNGVAVEVITEKMLAKF